MKAVECRNKSNTTDLGERSKKQRFFLLKNVNLVGRNEFRDVLLIQFYLIGQSAVNKKQHF